MKFCSKIYLNSIIVLTKASLVRMNKHSILGSAWALLQPFVHMCVISYIFSVLLKQPAELMIKNLAVSLPLWSFFNLSCNNGGMALMLRENIIKKSSLSTLMYVIADLSVGLILLCHGMIAMCVFVAIIYPNALSLTWLLIPFVGAPFVISVLAVAVILAYAVPYIRDIPQLVMMLISTLYWTVPIVYPYSIIPESKQWIFDINPLFLLINPVQVLMVESRVPDMIALLKALFVMSISVVISMFAYRKLSRRVVYYL
jgi:lipopolysaccharide transport system permease protein